MSAVQPPPAPPKAPPSDEAQIDALYQTEFQANDELTLRIASIALGGAALWIYNGSLVGCLWALAYLISLTMGYVLLHPRADGRARSLVACYVTFTCSVVSYLAFPVYLVRSGDPLLFFSGNVALIAYAFFTLYRPTPPGILRFLDFGLAAILVAIIASTILQSEMGLFERSTIALLSAVLALYYGLAMREIRAARTRLQTAAERTLEAQKLEAIGRLSGGVAHDFNNILTVVQGNLELYHEVSDGPERDALVEEARTASVRATSLVAQLLAFARRAPLEARPHRANDIVEDLGTLAKRLLPVSIDLQTRLTDHEAHVLADANGLHSALLNLILNANDALQERGSIIVAVDSVDGPAREGGTAPKDRSPTARHLCFSVTDNGPGMSLEVQRRAMEPFFTTKPVGKGSGLGLSMAMGFAEQSGGALDIQTSARGTTVAVHLPMGDASQGGGTPP